MRLSKLCSLLALSATTFAASAALAEDPPKAAPPAATAPSTDAAAHDQAVRAAVTSLVFDVRKVVEIQAASGWKIDRYEYEKMMPDTLLSVCPTTDEVRGFALAELAREVTRLGGPLEEALKRNGNEIGELKDLLFATRAQHTLAEAVRRAPSECPLWITPKTSFRSIQTGVDRFTLTAEGGGTGMVQYSADHPEGTTGFTLGGGGGGRLLLGRGFNHVWSVRTGAELNVIALLKRDDVSTSLPLQFLGAIPIIVRYTDISWHYNVEVAPLGLVTEEDTRIRYGFRVGAMIGISTLQVRSFIPWAGVGGAVEVFPDFDGRSMLLNLKGGVRAGVDWDFGSF